jgi:hypothetical protein
MKGKRRGDAPAIYNILDNGLGLRVFATQQAARWVSLGQPFARATDA